MLPSTDQMVALYPRTHGPECADKYRAVAEWWRLHATMSANPDQALGYAGAQDIKADNWKAGR